MVGLAGIEGYIWPWPIACHVHGGGWSFLYRSVKEERAYFARIPM